MKVFWDNSTGNFGDELTPFILRRCGIPVEWAPTTEAEMFAIGSLVEAIPHGFEGYVLGSGKMFADSDVYPRLAKAKVLALRGPLTGSAPLYADLGLLARGGFLRIARGPLAWMPHYVDERDEHDPTVTKHSHLHSIRRIDVRQDPFTVLRQLEGTVGILTSSLHGLIVADSLGLPSMWLPHEGVLGEGFKFDDYAASYDKRMTAEQWRWPDKEAIAQKKDGLRKALREVRAASEDPVHHRQLLTEEERLALAHKRFSL